MKSAGVTIAGGGLRVWVDGWSTVVAEMFLGSAIMMRSLERASAKGKRKSGEDNDFARKPGHSMKDFRAKVVIAGGSQQEVMQTARREVDLALES